MIRFNSHVLKVKQVQPSGREVKPRNSGHTPCKPAVLVSWVTLLSNAHHVSSIWFAPLPTSHQRLILCTEPFEGGLQAVITSHPPGCTGVIGGSELHGVSLTKQQCTPGAVMCASVP